MRDVNVGRGSHHFSINDHSGGGFPWEIIAALFVVAIVVKALAAVAVAIAAILTAIFWCAVGLGGLAVAGTVFVLVRRHAYAKSLVARGDPPPRVTSGVRRPALNGGQGGPARLHPDDIEALADALVRRAR